MGGGMDKAIGTFFQVFLGLLFLLYVPLQWLLLIFFGFDLTGCLGLHPVLPPGD